jgi:hypothetical protein
LPASIETVTTVAEMESIFNNYFTKNVIYLKTKSGNFKIKYIGFSEEKVFFQIPLIKKMPDQCIVMCRIPGETMYAVLQFMSKDDDDVYRFHPMKIQIIAEARKQERVATEQSGKKLLFVTKVISDFILEQTLSFESRKVDLIRSTILNQIEKTFPYKKIFLRNEGLSDIRMRYFYQFGSDYIVPSIPEIDTSDQIQKNYLNTIYQKDYYLNNRKQYISEGASVIRYQHAIPIGYIQVNHTRPLEASAFEMVKKLSTICEKLFIKNKVFRPLDEKLLVSDISKKGVGIVFNDRTYIRYFQENSYVHFVLILPDQLHLPLFAVVRNISFIEKKIIKIGCELINVDKNVMLVYENFLTEMI